MPGHLVVGRSLNNLAMLYQSQGRYSEAETLLKRAIAIKQMTLRSEHPSVALSNVNLGSIIKSDGRIDEAEPYLKRGLEVSKATLGERAVSGPRPDTASGPVPGLRPGTGEARSLDGNRPYLRCRPPLASKSGVAWTRARLGSPKIRMSSSVPSRARSERT